MYDNNFTIMKDMFLHNLKDNFDLNEIRIDSPIFDINLPEHLKYGGGIEIWKSRVNSIIEIIKLLPENEVFVFSDIDIVFYKPVIPTLLNLIKNTDLLFLREFYDGIFELQGGNINFGFNVIRANQKTLKFFQDVILEVSKSNTWEQKVINQLLYNENDYNIEWNLLPATFLSTSVGFKNINKDILLYHANCALTNQSKFDLINQVNQIVHQTCA